jgi:hypothetical protein
MPTVSPWIAKIHLTVFVRLQLTPLSQALMDEQQCDIGKGVSGRLSAAAG